MNKMLKKKNIFLILFSLILIFTSCSNEEVKEKIPTTVNSMNVLESSEYLYVYNLNGIARIARDDTGRITEIRTLDAVTLLEPFSNDDSYISRYGYDNNGNLTSLYYMGNEFEMTETDESGRAVVALSGEGARQIKAEFSYFDNGVISEERFTQNGKLVNKNIYNSNGAPLSYWYDGYGKLSFTYVGNEIYITIQDDKSNEMTNVTLVFDESGNLTNSIQEAQGAVSNIKWTFDDEFRCIDAYIENTFDGMMYKEEYEIYRDESGKVDEILYLSPNSEGNPVITKKIVYSYDSDNRAIKQLEITYSDDGNIEKNFATEFSDNTVIETTETYSNEALQSKTVNKTEYDKQKRVVNGEIYNYSSSNELVTRNYSEYKYDSYGTLVQRTTDTYDKNDMLLYYLIEDYVYNDNQLVESVTYSAFGSNDALMEKEIDEFVYDENGNFVKRIISLFDANEKLVSLAEYDADGNLISDSK